MLSDRGSQPIGALLRLDPGMRVVDRLPFHAILDQELRAVVVGHANDRQDGDAHHPGMWQCRALPDGVPPHDGGMEFAVPEDCAEERERRCHGKEARDDGKVPA